MPQQDDSERVEPSSDQSQAGFEPDASRSGASRRSTAEEIATEGLFIASAATRLALKNRIVIDTLSGNVNFSIDAYMDAAREALRSLATEAEAEAMRLEPLMKKAQRRRRDAKSSHDYQRADLENLWRRREQADTVARMLRERVTDDEAVEALVQIAHQAAWDDISRNIQFNLDTKFATVGDLTEEEARERQERIKEVMLIDLPKLENDVRRLKQKRAAGARMARSAAETGRSDAPERKFFGGFRKRIRRR